MEYLELKMHHLLKYPERPDILPNNFSPALLIKSLIFSIPEPVSSGLSKKAELDIEEAPWNLFKFCFKLVLLY